MRARLEAAFTLHPLERHDPEAITHVVTNGHDGIKPEVMAALPNLQAIKLLRRWL